MVIYDLQCDNQHSFEGWFKNADDLDAQRSSGMLTCPVCDSNDVKKKLTAPKIGRKSNSAPETRNEVAVGPQKGLSGGGESGTKEGAPSYEQLQRMLGQVHKFVDSNFTDVGNRFAKEALKIHNGEKDPENIRGVASKSELKELAEEGVTAVPLPPKPVDKTKLN